jgi:hypothetical protein
MDQNKQNKNTPQMSLTKKELRHAYNVSTSTFKRMLAQAGIKNNNKILYPFEVGILIERYGHPLRKGSNKSK